MLCCFIISSFLLSGWIRHNKSLTWGGYRILVKGVRDMDRQKWSPAGGGGGGSPEAKMCSPRKYPYPPHGRLMEISRGRGVSKAKFFE